MSETPRPDDLSSPRPEQVPGAPTGRKVGVYVCHCGGNISDYVDVERVASEALGEEAVVVARSPMFACSEAGQQEIAEDIEKQPAVVDALVALMTKEAAVRGDILAGMAAGLDGFSTAKKPKGWDELATRSEGFQPSPPRPRRGWKHAGTGFCK